MNSKKVSNHNLRLWEGLSPVIVEDVTREKVRIPFKAGDERSLSDPGGNCLYVVESGSIEFTNVAAEPGKATAVRVVGPGEFFGEATLFVSEPAQLRFKALKSGILLRLTRAEFVNISFFNPSVPYQFFKQLEASVPFQTEAFSEIRSAYFRDQRKASIAVTASKLSNDLQAPLTVIALTSQLISNLFPEASEYANNIQEEARIIENLVAELADYVTGSSFEMNLSRVDLDEFMGDILEAYGTSLKGQNIELKLENKVQTAVFIDRERIRRVILNLLRNAAEAMSGAGGEIKISTTLASNWLQISVTDNGPGIPECIAERVFEPFVTYGKRQGNGLGLPICAKILKEHSGRLDFLPVKPHGARFDIRLPQNFT